MLEDITSIFRDAFELPWEDEASMWAWLAASIGCTEERAKYLGGVLAFCAPFDGRTGRYLGQPGAGTCKYCAQGVVCKGMCLKHYRSYEKYGDLGVYQYHRICVDGRLDVHSPPTPDGYGTPRCTKCHKSMLHVATDLYKEKKGKRYVQAQQTKDQEARELRNQTARSIRALAEERKARKRERLGK